MDDILITTLTPGPVTIVEQPQDQTVGQGFTSTFSVAVDGSRPYSFQWRMNGVEIPGATGVSYTTPPTVTGMNGAVYDVLVSLRLHGSVTPPLE